MSLTKTYKKGIVLLMLLMLLVSARAQKMAIRLADSNFRDFNYITAIEYYEYAYERDSSDNYVIRRLAEANNNIGKSEEVETWLRILVRRGTAEAEDLYQYATVPMHTYMNTCVMHSRASTFHHHKKPKAKLDHSACPAQSDK